MTQSFRCTLYVKVTKCIFTFSLSHEIFYTPPLMKTFYIFLLQFMLNTTGLSGMYLNNTLQYYYIISELSVYRQISLLTFFFYIKTQYFNDIAVNITMSCKSLTFAGCKQTDLSVLLFIFIFNNNLLISAVKAFSLQKRRKH